MSTPDAKEHWEQRYAERDKRWSGRVNVRLAEIVSSFPPGHALDLGCGEGADAWWLAERGWTVVAVDISDIALQRAAAGAEERGVSDRIRFEQCDLSQSFPDGTFDLISAQFLHSMIPFDRPKVLRRAATAVRPGGALVIVDHAGPPPWASELDHHHHDFPSAEQVIEGLELGDEWERERVDAVEREVAGQTATWTDNVIVLRRR
ncbi:bifunctional 2-polyprenyl-6-hydroxyphenol methylase/3-demethylubiquinol 3-O-methyltransferase UbiG [Mycobacterium sp. 3519A]|jgi:ubiquinone/menaquinone biosynthesis C-methylase UbiE|uniref:class I SAM-dependent methyltransferase n=1 Tax=Mycobacterium sp. 3519A TaxID=2057184 RepID=UPI000C7BEACE|nr:class I SAM-dependent methyltransferase [Mycobacterium sp. 3519A]